MKKVRVSLRALVILHFLYIVIAGMYSSAIYAFPDFTRGHLYLVVIMLALPIPYLALLIWSFVIRKYNQVTVDPDGNYEIKMYWDNGSSWPGRPDTYSKILTYYFQQNEIYVFQNCYDKLLGTVTLRFPNPDYLILPVKEVGRYNYLRLLNKW